MRRKKARGACDLLMIHPACCSCQVVSTAVCQKNGRVSIVIAFPHWRLTVTVARETDLDPPKKPASSSCRNSDLAKTKAALFTHPSNHLIVHLTLPQCHRSQIKGIPSPQPPNHHATQDPVTIAFIALPSSVNPNLDSSLRSP